MAIYQWNESDYTEMLLSLRKQIGPHPIRTLLVFVVAAALSVWLWTLKQYAFDVVLWAVIIGFGFYDLKFSVWTARRWFRMNRMAGKVFQVTLSDEVVEVQVAGNHLVLRPDDIRYVSLNDKVARIQHQLGVDLYIPRDVLSAEEENILRHFEQRFSASGQKLTSQH